MRGVRSTAGGPGRLRNVVESSLLRMGQHLDETLLLTGLAPGFFLGVEALLLFPEVRGAETRHHL